MLKPVEIFRTSNIVGEGILWDPRHAALWWTDIQSSCLHRFDWTSRRLEVIDTPDRVGSFGLIENRDGLIVAFAGGIALYNPRTRAQESLPLPDVLPAGVRFNDGRVDRQGRFWAGTMVEGSQTDAAGSLYMVDAARHVRRQVRSIRIANGLCFDPSGTLMYFADSPTRRIWAYEVPDEGAALSPPRLFAETPEGAFPDGATVDVDGCVWSAHWGAGCIVRYTPAGKIDQVISLPTCQPSCVCFAGPNLDVLCVTSAREGLNEQSLGQEPHAGDVFLFHPGIQGLSESYYVCA